MLPAEYLQLNIKRTVSVARFQTVSRVNKKPFPFRNDETTIYNILRILAE